ncbi:hypothetical protein B0H14DRAFT_2736090, partial [Mycena olivaceomarginata]
DAPPPLESHGAPAPEGEGAKLQVLTFCSACLLLFAFFVEIASDRSRFVRKTGSASWWVSNSTVNHTPLLIGHSFVSDMRDRKRAKEMHQSLVMICSPIQTELRFQTLEPSYRWHMIPALQVLSTCALCEDQTISEVMWMEVNNVPPDWYKSSGWSEER